MLISTSARTEQRAVRSILERTAVCRSGNVHLEWARGFVFLLREAKAVSQHLLRFLTGHTLLHRSPDLRPARQVDPEVTFHPQENQPHDMWEIRRVGSKERKYIIGGWIIAPL